MLKKKSLQNVQDCSGFGFSILFMGRVVLVSPKTADACQVKLEYRTSHRPKCCWDECVKMNTICCVHTELERGLRGKCRTNNFMSGGRPDTCRAIFQLMRGPCPNLHFRHLDNLLV